MKLNKLIIEGSDDKKIITFTISPEIKNKLKEVLINSEDYNLKRKSDWINESIQMLTKNSSFKDLVVNAEGSESNYVFDKIYMTFEQRCFFAELRNNIVKEYPDIKGPQAAIMRAAIFSRLFRNK